MKKIETLVEDIYALFRSDRMLDAASSEGFTKSLALRIAEKTSAQRGPPSLRLSNLGIEPRKLWYTINRPELAEALPPEARMKFLYGDILEEMLLWLAREAGHDVVWEQLECEMFGVKGHIDAVIDGVLVDVKSASSYSYNKFADGGIFKDDPFGYVMQLDAYGAAIGGPGRDIKRAWLVVDKTLGKLQLTYCPDQKIDYEKHIAGTKAMLSLPNPPPRSYQDEYEGKSGNKKLGVACSYCAWKDECWPNLRTFLYSRGPVFLTQVKKLPEVPEVR